GVSAADEIATAYCGEARAALGRAYLRDNIQYAMGERETAGLRAYFELAARHSLIDAPREPLFYQD
nr:hypothetical protein [Acidobacteriota bacterium]